MRRPEGFGLFRFGLLAFSIAPAVVLLFAGWALSHPLAGAASAFALVLSIQILAEAAFLSGRRSLVFLLARLSFGALKILPPRRGRLLGAEKMVVALNNSLMERAAPLRPKPSRILLLLPHCLQDHECPVRLVHDVYACRRCGRCDISGLLALAGARGAAVAVATGGTLARKAVEREAPDLVVAVACARDLSSGIMDSWPLRVWGQLNEQPHGECFDTRVDLTGLARALELLTGQGDEGEDDRSAAMPSRPLSSRD